LRLEYALEGTSNFTAWKDIMEAFLDDNGVLEYTKTDSPKKAASNAQQQGQWNKDNKILKYCPGGSQRPCGFEFA